MDGHNDEHVCNGANVGVDFCRSRKLKEKRCDEEMKRINVKKEVKDFIEPEPKKKSSEDFDLAVAAGHGDCAPAEQEEKSKNNQRNRFVNATASQ